MSVDSKSFEDRLEQALALRTVLNDTTGALNTSLRMVETGLRSLAFGTVACVPLRFDTVLAWRKRGEDWGLFIERTAEGGVSIVPLLQGSRAERIAAANAMLLLLEALIARVNEEATSVKRALLNVQSALDAIDAACRRTLRK